MWDVGVSPATSGRVRTYSNNKLWFSPREGMAEWKHYFLFFSLSLKVHLFVLPFLEGGRPSCTAGIVLGTFSDTHTPCFWLTLGHTHTHLPLSWHVLQRRSVFIRSRPSLHYLELLMQRAMWTWNWKQMFHIDSSLRDYQAHAFKQAHTLTYVSVCACLIQKNHFLDVTFRMWVNCVSQKPKDFWAACTLFPPHALICPLLCCLSWLKSSTWNLVNTWLIGYFCLSQLVC